MVKFAKFSILMFLLFNFIYVSIANAVTITAVSCSQSDVQAAIDSASDGDTVYIPACTATWTTLVEIPNTKGIKLLGAGIDSTIITPNVTGLTSGIRIRTSSGNSPVEFGQLTFSGGIGGTEEIIEIIGNAIDFRLHHIKFDSVSRRSIYINGAASGAGPFGLIDNCLWVHPHHVNQGVYVIGGADSWSVPHSFGTADAVYIEDCEWDLDTFTAGYGAMDGRDGCRIVFRNNTVRNENIKYHGYDSGPGGGGLQVEVYDNVFIHDDTANDMAHYMFWRGGTGYVYNNTLTSVGGSNLIKLYYYRSCTNQYKEGYCDGSKPVDDNEADTSGIAEAGTSTSMTDNDANWSTNKWSSPYGYYIYNVTDGGDPALITSNTSTVISFTGGIGDDFESGDTYKITNGDPCYHQPGMGVNQVLTPWYEYNNTRNGGDIDFTVEGCDRVLDQIRLNVHYYNDNQKPDYTPYTYPHPLRTTKSDSLPPQPPRNLKVVK